MLDLQAERREALEEAKWREALVEAEAESQRLEVSTPQQQRWRMMLA